MAEAWDRQDSGSAAVSWDSVPYEPFKIIQNETSNNNNNNKAKLYSAQYKNVNSNKTGRAELRGGPNRELEQGRPSTQQRTSDEIIPPKNKNNQKRNEDDSLKTALEWVTNPKRKEFSRPTQRYNNDDRHHYISRENNYTQQGKNIYSSRRPQQNSGEYCEQNNQKPSRDNVYRFRGEQHHNSISRRRGIRHQNVHENFVGNGLKYVERNTDNRYVNREKADSQTKASSYQGNYSKEHNNFDEVPNRGKPFQRGHQNRRGNWKANSGERQRDNSNLSSSNPDEDKDKRKIYPMSIRRLRELVEENSEELLLTAINSRGGFQQLLEENILKPEVMALILEVLGKACDSKQTLNMMKLFRMLNANKNFSMLVMRFALSLTNDDCQPHYIDSLSYFLWYLLSFQRALPALGSDFVAIVLPLIKDTVNKLIMADKLDDLSVLDVISELEQEKGNILSNASGHDLKLRIFEEESHSKPPPNDFRSLSIFPSKDDLADLEPYIRPIITAGGYTDVEHYLDVQFRLLREDFVRPLREGINKYKQCTNKNPKAVNGLHIYKGVHILFPRCTMRGVLHNICFDVAPFRRFNWEAEKRLLPGSLVCLSSDDFETMLFAEVSSRDPMLLGEGILDIKFDKLDDSILKLRPSETFVMLETSAYFEAYRHNLKKLQTLDAKSLPLSNYIVNVKKEIGSPGYLRNMPRVKYDLRPLMMPLPDTSVSRIVMQDSEFYSYEFPAPLGNGKKVELLKESEWPPPHELNVDNNQYRALQTALTKEFVIIQGPPGTGKTFIGLRIVQTLIHNRDVRCKHCDTPILIVCYTNHALDQFLEGVLTFTTSLVRIGGNTEHLEEHKLSHLRQQRREKRLMASSMRSSIYDLIKNLKVIKYQVDRVEKVLTNLKHTVITERDLEPFMEEILVESLRRKETYGQSSDSDDGKLILDWLELRLKGIYIPRWLQDDEIVAKEDHQNEKEPDDSEIDIIRETTKLDVMDDSDEDEKDVMDLNDIKEEASENRELSDDGEIQWKTLGESEKRKRYIEKQLKKYSMMPPEKISELTNVWLLPLESRWSLYKAWVARFAREKLQSIIELVKQYQEELLRYQELKHTEDLNILKSVCVVGMTTTGAAKYEALVRDLRPKIVVIEEAAEVLESHIVTSLSNDTEQLILIGDHQQLKPTTTMFELGEKYNLSISLFERMVKNGLPCQKLITQYRMRPSIRRLLTPHIYPKLLDHSSVKSLGRVKGLAAKVFFINHNIPDSRERNTTSFVNVHEAKFVIALCKHLILQEYKPSQITILSTYSRQTFVIQKMVRSSPIFNGVHITSVDNYQGNENDIVLISFVRSNEEGNIGFLKVSNRVCVALSRAKKGLYCIGNFQFLAENSDLWKDITKHLESKNEIGQALHLVCQNHPEVSFNVSTAEGFSQAPEGGCTQMCQHRLEKCGHTCPRVCHPCDSEHKIYKCKEKCNKILASCTREHRCKKPCFECTEKGSCGNCIIRVEQKLPCGHTIGVACHSYGNKVICPDKCQRILNCGHACRNTCGGICTVTCQEIVDCLTPCGHLVKIECYMKNDKHKLLASCDQPCNTELMCGHMCQGSCGSCFQNRFHKRCQNVCNRILVCGHKCTAFCSANCPPCRENCWNQCAHSHCKQKCSVPCQECRMPCELKCPHRECNSHCGEMCTVEPCSKPCKKLLKCKHLCVGLCGDPCPRLCRHCNYKELTETFFGTETDDCARFVRLEDCGHVFEVEGLQKWMETFKSGTVRMPCCPRCTKVMWTNSRFCNIIKFCHSRVEKVKVQVLGNDVKKLKQEQDELKAICETLDKEVEHSVRMQVHRVLKLLGHEKHLNSGMNTTLRNILNFLQVIGKCIFKLHDMKKFMNTILINGRPLSESVEEIQNETLIFVAKALKQDDQCSQQQLVDMEREILRLSLLCTVCKEFHLNVTKSLSVKRFQELFEIAHDVLSSSLYLLDEDISSIIEPVINDLKRSRGAPLIDVTEEEKVQIIEAIGLSQGHWYQCTNGHVYCIDRCGGPMEEAQCPECQSKIGGMDHKLLPGNQVAYDMDGAEHGAWSEETNMANFDPREFQ